MTSCAILLQRFEIPVHLLLHFVSEGEQGQKTLKWRSLPLDLLSAVLNFGVLAMS